MCFESMRLVWIAILVIAAPAFSSVENFPSVHSDRSTGIPRKGCEYAVQAGLDGEIYPVFANYASLQKQGSRSFAVVAITVNNPGQASVRQKIEVELPGWSDREIQLVEAEPGKRQTLMFAPSFLPRFYQNREIVAATAHV